MVNLRLWLFRVLVAIAAGLMLASFIMPWWSTVSIYLPGFGVQPPPPDAVRIYGWGLQHDLVTLRSYIATDETPFYQTVLAWVYLAVSVGLILFSTFLKGRKGKWLLGGIGSIYIAYAAIAGFVVIAGRLAELGLPLQGFGVMSGASIKCTLRSGYYLAYGAGLMCIILALLRGVIVGKHKSPTQ